MLVILSHPLCGALNMEAETRDTSLSIIPAQAGVHFSPPGFRVAAYGPRIKYGAGSPGMTGSSVSSFQRKLESRGCGEGWAFCF